MDSEALAGHGDLIRPQDCVFFIPDGLKEFKKRLFERVSYRLVQSYGGKVVQGNVAELGKLTYGEYVPIIGCSVELRHLVERWRATGLPFIYWDRGYWLRLFKCGLPCGEFGGSYRWHVNSFQAQEIRNVPLDRWTRDSRTMGVGASPWRKGGRHVLVLAPTERYAQFHRLETWLDETLARLKTLTDRPVVVREKESPNTIVEDMTGAHVVVGHGSNGLNEAIVHGYPVICDASCAAALVGLTDLGEVEHPVYPDRTQWLATLAYSQFTEKEMGDGTLWNLLT